MIKIFLSLLFLSSGAFGASEKRDLNEFKLSVRYGEKNVEYRYRKKSGDLVKWESGIESKKIRLSEDNEIFLAEKFQKISNLQTHDLALCSGRFIQVEFKIQNKFHSKTACTQSSNLMAQSLTEVANLLGFL